MTIRKLAMCIVAIGLVLCASATTLAKRNPEIHYHADCQVIPGGAWEIVQSGWNFFEPYTYWAKVETYASDTGTYVAKAGANPDHGGTLWGYFATAYLYVE